MQNSPGQRFRGGCSGFRFSLDKDEIKQDGDISISHNVITDPISEGFLSTATLTYLDDPFQSTYKFEVPNARSCGCGSSFHLRRTHEGMDSEQSNAGRHLGHYYRLGALAPLFLVGCTSLKKRD